MKGRSPRAGDRSLGFQRATNVAEERAGVSSINEVDRSMSEEEYNLTETEWSIVLGSIVTVPDNGSYGDVFPGTVNERR